MRRSLGGRPADQAVETLMAVMLVAVVQRSDAHGSAAVRHDVAGSGFVTVAQLHLQLVYQQVQLRDSKAGQPQRVVEDVAWQGTTKLDTRKVDEVNLMTGAGLSGSEVDDLTFCSAQPRGGDNVCNGDRG